MLNLNPETIRHANAASQFDAGDALAREASRVYENGLAKMTPDRPLTDEQRAILDRRAAEWKTLVESAYNDNIARRASWVPWTVAGRSNYPAERMNRRADAAMNAAAEWSAKMERFIENTRRAIDAAEPLETVLAEYRSGKRRAPISADDPDAAAKLQARLEGLKERHERKKRINAYWRKCGTLTGCRDLSAEAAAEVMAALNSPQHYGERVPFPSWDISNENAEIKRLGDRLNAIRRAEAAGDARQTFAGFTVEIRGADARINLTFDDKPDADARELLKKNGLHWSPREKVWTRVYTANALYTVKELLVPALLKLPAYAPTETASETANAAETVQDAPEAAGTEAPAAETEAPAAVVLPVMTLAELAALLTA